MRTSERLLLYATAVVLGGSLVFGGVINNAVNQAGPVGQGDEDAAVSPFSREGTTMQLRSLELVDEAGLPRIRLAVEEDGRSQVLLLDPEGSPAITLKVNSTGGAEITARNQKSHAGLSVQPSGELSFLLNQNDGGSARMGISKSGEADVSVVTPSNTREATLRTDSSGAAEVAVHSPGVLGGPSMSILANGQMGLSVKSSDGVTGPVMQLFPDGLAEIAVTGADGKSGPVMMSMPEGLSVVSLRRKGGNLGASMVLAPDGSAVVAASAGQGAGEASLRIDHQGKPTVEVADPETGIRQPLQPGAE